jgi:heme exporter protein A
LWLRGANGAGKSTLLRVLAGFLPFQSGALHFTGLADEDEPALLMHYLGYNDGLKSTLSVAENLSFWAELLGQKGEQEGENSHLRCSVEAALARMGLARLAMLPAAYLSAGQKKRLAMARLLVSARPIWLLDEPSLTLDQQGQNLLAEVMAEHQQSGGAIIFASHTPLALPDVREYALGALA